ncbi:hypothetical protein [Nocardia sp. X0981]
MAEQPTSTDSTSRGGRRNRGFSPGLLISGLLALLVSAWTLLGPGHWELTSIVPLGWLVVATAIVIGLFLVVSPRKHR